MVYVQVLYKRYRSSINVVMRYVTQYTPMMYVHVLYKRYRSSINVVRYLHPSVGSESSLFFSISRPVVSNLSSVFNTLYHPILW